MSEQADNPEVNDEGDEDDNEISSVDKTDSNPNVNINVDEIVASNESEDKLLFLSLRISLPKEIEKMQLKKKKCFRLINQFPREQTFLLPQRRKIKFQRFLLF